MKYTHKLIHSCILCLLNCIFYWPVLTFCCCCVTWCYGWFLCAHSLKSILHWTIRIITFIDLEWILVSKYLHMWCSFVLIFVKRMVLLVSCISEEAALVFFFVLTCAFSVNMTSLKTDHGLKSSDFWVTWKVWIALTEISVTPYPYLTSFFLQ